MMLYGYIRALENCSPEKDISLKNQMYIMNSLSISSIFIDEISKDNYYKEQFGLLMDKLKSEDIVVITKISRIAERLAELFDVCTVFTNNNVTLRVIEIGDITNNNNISNEQWLNALRKFEEDIRRN